MENEAPGIFTKLIGGLMLGCGCLVMGLTGACSVMVVASWYGRNSIGRIWELFGSLGLPFLIGLAIFIGGYKLVTKK